MSDFQLTAEQREQLSQISTATLTSVLIKRGIRRSFMLEVFPLVPHLRLAGTAFTLRYIPSRQDLTDRRYNNETNIQRIAIESIGEGQVLVIDARGITDVGTMGDILATRIQQRGAAGVVTDGGLRDTPALAEMGFPIFLGGGAAPPSHLEHHPVDINQPIGCGNVAVIPGDLIVGDGEGVVVVPQQLAKEVIAEAWEQEQLEAWVVAQIQDGKPIKGLYPPDDTAMARFKAQTGQS